MWKPAIVLCWVVFNFHIFYFQSGVIKLGPSQQSYVWENADVEKIVHTRANGVHY